MPNRIQAAYARMENQVKERIVDGYTTQEAVDKLNETLNMDIGEYVKFQELKSLAVANGILTPDEGMTIYNSLGEQLETFNSQPVHVKSVLTQLFSELSGKALLLNTR